MSRMSSKKDELCFLCKNEPKLTSHKLLKASELQTLGFLANQNGSVVPGTIVCGSCYQNVKMITDLKLKTQPMIEEPIEKPIKEESQTPIEEVFLKEHQIFSDVDEASNDTTLTNNGVRPYNLDVDDGNTQDTLLSDFDYEELNQLSAYYAEHDDEPEPAVSTTANPVSKKRKLAVTNSARAKRKTRSQSNLLCQLCDSTLTRVASLRRHYITQHKYDPSQSNQISPVDHPIPCIDCDQVFSNQNGLIKHILQNHAEAGLTNFSCPNCPKTYRHEHDLKNHMDRLCVAGLPKDSDGRIECDICHKFIHPIHRFSHRSNMHTCRFCDKIFQNRKEKMSHLKETHYEEMTDICPNCLQRFETASALRHHFNAHHEKQINCSRCQKTFPKGSKRFRLHIKICQVKVDDAKQSLYKHECTLCKKRFKSQRLVKQHVDARHNPNLPMIKCDFCDYMVPRMRRCELYRTHVKSRHPEQVAEIAKFEERVKMMKEDLEKRAKVQCYLCPFAATSSCNMMRHYIEMHGYDKTRAACFQPDPESPDGELCPECGEHFVTKHNMIKHILKLHTKSTGEQCLYCSRRYNDVVDHINMMHPDDKASNIQFCRKCVPEQNFPSFDELLRHTRSYHQRRLLDTRMLDTPFDMKNRKSGTTTKLICESCGKKVASTRMAGHRSECTRTLPNLVGEKHDPLAPNSDQSSSKSKKYVPVHVKGICPYCEFKFADLLGHIRHGHEKEKESKDRDLCYLCGTRFNSVRELISHRQKHPQYKNHVCRKCKNEFEEVVELRAHAKDCGKTGTKRKRIEQSMPLEVEAVRSKPTEFEGRGTVPCHICMKMFTLKNLLKRHYVSHHGYDSKQVQLGDPNGPEKCLKCDQNFTNKHSLIKHHMDYHAVLSGKICPYCERKSYLKKFENLDEHVQKHHLFQMQSPIQTCSTCKMNFNTYEELRDHRQHHEGGNRRLVELVNNSNQGQVSVASRLVGYPEIANKGGVKCQLCNTFKLRKSQLTQHYIKHHGYDPKAKPEDDGNAEDGSENNDLPCPACQKSFPNNNALIKHILKLHCHYTGQICPYCKGHFPERYIDLQSHVTKNHMEQLTGYNVINKCKVCHRQFSGYAELRDHVQTHGDGFRDPYGNRQVRKQRDAEQPSSIVDIPDHITIMTSDGEPLPVSTIVTTDGEPVPISTIVTTGGEPVSTMTTDQITIIASAMEEQPIQLGGECLEDGELVGKDMPNLDNLKDIVITSNANEAPSDSLLLTPNGNEENEEEDQQDNEPSEFQLGDQNMIVYISDFDVEPV